MAAPDGDMKDRISIGTLVIVLSLMAPSIAGATSGSAALTGTSRLGVRGCHGGRMTFSGTVVVYADGTWTATGGSDNFAGTYAAAGRTGRKLVLTLDEPSKAAFIASVAEDIQTLCDTPPVTVTNSRAKVLALTLNRKLTKAKLVVKYSIAGNAGGRSGTATYRLIGRGAWTAG